MSLPGPALIVSEPPAPDIMSSPARPSMVSSVEVPRRTSTPAVPVIAATGVCACAPVAAARQAAAPSAIEMRLFIGDLSLPWCGTSQCCPTERARRPDRAHRWPYFHPAASGDRGAVDLEPDDARRARLDRPARRHPVHEHEPGAAALGARGGGEGRHEAGSRIGDSDADDGTGQRDLEADGVA